MNLELACEKCQRLLSVPPECLGKKVQCAACGNVQTARTPPVSAAQPDEPLPVKPVVDERKLARPTPQSDSGRRITREARQHSEPVLSGRRHYEEDDDDLRSRRIDCPYCRETISSTADGCRWCGRSIDVELIEEDLHRLQKERTRQNLFSFAFGIPGLLLLVGGDIGRAVLRVNGAGNEFLAFPIMFLGAALLFVGSIFFARYKGQNSALGLLVFGGCIGLIVLLVMDDKKSRQIRRLKRFLRDY
jgi:DNA-directed RNA polymerase subunit M/transcription elongation factor TFIIS